MSFQALAWATKLRLGKAGDKLILVAFADRHNEETGCAYPSIAWLTEFSSLDRKTVIAAVERLVDAGLLEDSGERKGSTKQIKVYRVHVGRVPETVQSQKRNSSEIPSKESQKRDTEPVREPTISEAKASSMVQAENDNQQPFALIGDPRPVKRGKAKAEPTASERENFDAFWSVYPRREGKQPALLAYVVAIRSGSDPNRILTGAQRYAAVRQGQDPKLTKMAQGWLNDRRWEDEIAEPPPSGYRDHRGTRDAWDPIQQAIDGMDFDRDDAA
ncbi:helix-turn-helix domain-containing protein [Brevundimonas naejangsanensis]|uniref:helix-turn-helix domain-containing protein n=1 Tax=Brevundimonas naejangsanensis TaxID=588932 RepID=UPI0034D5F105